MRRLAWFLLIAFSFAIPWEYSLDLGAPFGDIARITGLLVLLVVIPAVLQTGRIRKPATLHWLMLAFFLWFCCSYFWSVEPVATLERMRAFVQVMMVAPLAWELVESWDDLRNLIRANVAGCVVLALLTVADFASPTAAGQIRFVAEGQDPNDAARFLDLGFPLATLLVLVERRRWTKILALGYLPLGLLSVLLSASRGGVLAAAIAIAGCAFLLFRSRPQIAFRGMLAAPMLLLLFWRLIPSATLARIASMGEQLSGGDLNQRLNIWIAGWRAFAHAPLLGSGAGTFVASARLAQFDTAHNTALSIGVEGGLVALTLALAILVLAVRYVLRTGGAARGAFGTGLMICVVTSVVATVEANRSTWFLIALIAVAARLYSQTAGADSLVFGAGRSQAVAGSIGRGGRE
jgi:O-antigen ligase